MAPTLLRSFDAIRNKDIGSKIEVGSREGFLHLGEEEFYFQNKENTMGSRKGRSKQEK